eukprot:GFUD01118764.1.p1 GENE.GFUD01118764.1~~GFUD01118764.1.p1  ORF type:complete len:425 (+),score=100.11 GFUD01118764.1:35-1276(+)
MARDRTVSITRVLLLLAGIQVSSQCARKVATPAKEEGIRSERLVQLPDPASDLEVKRSSSDLNIHTNDLNIHTNDLNIHTNLDQNNVGDIETLLRTAKQIAKTDVEACPEIFQDGYQFYLSVVREQVLARDVDDCAIKCKQTAYCKSFSFSTTENADENCHLSELSVGNIDIAKDMTEDANWSVYGIAEDDRCLQTTEPTTTKQTSTKNCKCNGFIDNVGGGKCRQHSFGEWWCYVEGENDCPDSKKDAFMSGFSRSSHACSEGPCECNNFDFKKPGQTDICMKDLWDNDRFCYVPLESRCKDKRASKFFPSVYWSLQACSDNDTEEEGSGEDTTEAPPVVEEGVTYHSSWNFTSSHADCANYCTNSERCHYMHSKYDAREEICHLSTKPFYIVTHIHYGHHTHSHMGDWIKK